MDLNKLKRLADAASEEWKGLVFPDEPGPVVALMQALDPKTVSDLVHSQETLKLKNDFLQNMVLYMNEIIERMPNSYKNCREENYEDERSKLRKAFNTVRHLLEGGLS